MSRHDDPARAPRSRQDRSRRRRPPGLLLLAALLLLASCTTDPPEDDVPAYAPRPLESLVADVEDLPGVATATVTFSDRFSSGRAYRGRVLLERGADVDPVATLDAVNALLRQGEPDADLLVTVEDAAGERSWGANDLGLTGSRSLEERYGPQPGDGLPPEDAPTP